MNKKDVVSEKLNGLRTAIETLTGERRDTAEKLLEEIIFLGLMLWYLRERIEKEGPVIKTARTIKENPSMKTYNTTIQRYSLLFKQVLDLLPAPVAKQQTDALADFIKAGK